MNLSDPGLFINRELSWLEFNARVLAEALDPSNPITERFNFLAITANNLDEFFMVRVSGLMEQAESGITACCPAGLSPAEQLSEIAKKTHESVVRQYNCLNRAILPALSKENVRFLKYRELSPKQREYVADYFSTTVYPILTPMAIDSGRPFPLLNNKSLNFITELKSRDDDSHFAITQTPTVVSRVVGLPEAESGKRDFIMLEDIIRRHMGALFPGHKIKNNALFRVTKNSDLNLDEDDAHDLLSEIEQEIKRRKWGDPVRLEIEKSIDKDSRAFLTGALGLEDDYIYEISGYLDPSVWFFICGLAGPARLRYRPLRPQLTPAFYDRDIFGVIRGGDVLVHHPYESFDCVTEFIKQAARDADVLAIKQTLYRVSGNSPVVSHLIEAAENGKQVTVLVELRARFDEENNIIWAKKLENAGCHVVYGLAGLKTHCKACLVVRREDDGIRRYVHLGTGNYNDSTARIYTDLGFFTCRDTFGQDCSTLFNLLTGYSSDSRFNKIIAAPVSLRKTLIKYIQNEAKNAKNGDAESEIICKMNSLVDVPLIQELYKAAAAGVRIKLLVRGICCLRTDVPETAGNIAVTSIVGRFLEHSRIFCFRNRGGSRIYLSSADWMPRNMDRRVEIAFPVEDAELKERLIGILNIAMSDTMKQWAQNPDGSYEKIDRRGKAALNSQLHFFTMAERAAKEAVSESAMRSEPR